MKPLPKIVPLSKGVTYNARWIEKVYFFLNSELVKYTFTSLLATVCDFTTFYILNDVCHFPTLSAVLTGQIIGSIIAFILMCQWVFNFEERQAFVWLSLKYFGGQLASAAANVSVVGLIMVLFPLDAWVSRILTSVFLWLILFLVNKLWVFRTQKSV